MVFSSIIFLCGFLPIVLLLNFILPERFRNVFLFLASLVFYAWGEAEYALIMVFSIILNYLFALWIASSNNKYVLFLSVATNLAILGYFKYANFIVNNVNILLSFVNIKPILFHTVHLPIGISFFTFQAVSYIIDVHRRNVSANPNPVHIGLYITSFPQLIAGPIVRYRDVAKEIQKRSVTLEMFAEGVERFILGLGKKVLLANTLADTADKIFSVPVADMTTSLAWLGITCFTLYVYFDFSGYSDMAIGMGRMLGFHFLENFNFPYISQSVQEIWLRWHISMSSWFRDYLYISLGGSRRGTVRTYLNLWIVFFLCGLWHGSNWNFVLWGVTHGVFLVIERLGFEKMVARFWRPFRHIYAMTVFMVALVIFKLESQKDAMHYIAAMFGFSAGDGVVQHIGLYWNRELAVVFICGILFSMPVSVYLTQWKQRFIQLGYGVWQHALTLFFDITALLGLAMLILASMMSLASGAYNPFLYFRF